MTRHHSLPRAFAGLIAMTFLVGAQYSCRTDAPGQGAEEEPPSTEHEEAADGAGSPHWDYEGDTGPDRWGSLDRSFAVCDSGVQQSPVDLAGAIPAGGGGLQIRWQPTRAQVVDNGHTIQVNTEGGGAIMLEGREFSLLQFHFHLPSEHTADGSDFPMEVHFVHQAEEGDLAVIGVFLDARDAHAAIQTVWDAIPGVGESPAPIEDFDPNTLLPEGPGYSRYAGSLTTPPCSEVVSWVVMGESISVSQEQIDAFAALYPMNARPVQPLHRRFILMRQ